MKVIAFIPVRGGSKSIPLKNIKLLCGKPLVCWSIEALEKCELVDEIIVATDSNDMWKTVESQDYQKTHTFYFTQFTSVLNYLLVLSRELFTKELIHKSLIILSHAYFSEGALVVSVIRKKETKENLGISLFIKSGSLKNSLFNIFTVL